MAFLAPDAPSLSMTSKQPSYRSLTPITKWEYMTNRRSRKQASLFFLGATLVTLSTIVTRRSLHYRHQLSYPLFYIPSNAAPSPVNGTMEAIRALQLATANVVSVMVTASGGLLWAFDISSVNDLRTRIRGSVGAGKTKSAREMESWFEEWLAAKGKEKEKAGDDRPVVSDPDKETTGSAVTREE